MQPTVDVCILMLVKVPKRLDHHPRFLGGGCVIEIDQRMTVRLFAEDREIFAKGVPIYGATNNLVHIIICSAGRNAPLLFDGPSKDGTVAAATP